MATRVPGDRIVPVTSKTAGGEPVMPAKPSSGHVDVDFNSVGVGAYVKPSTTPTMTTDHPAFGGPASAAHPPKHTP